ncbi:unknown [Eggerthella sp. CAG:368]|nr:unknown [Eggerthella sp. CAG:368]
MLCASRVGFVVGVLRSNIRIAELDIHVLSVYVSARLCRIVAIAAQIDCVLVWTFAAINIDLITIKSNTCASHPRSNVLLYVRGRIATRRPQKQLLRGCEVNRRNRIVFPVAFHVAVCAIKIVVVANTLIGVVVFAELRAILVTVVVSRVTAHI